MSFDLSDYAAGALEDIAVYIAQESVFPERAIRFADALTLYCAEVAKIATVRTILHISPHTGIPFRYVPHRGYRIVYTLREGRVIIVDFMHGMQSEATVARGLDGFAP